jgi:hypothetical protein
MDLIISQPAANSFCCVVSFGDDRLIDKTYGR